MPVASPKTFSVMSYGPHTIYLKVYYHSARGSAPTVGYVLSSRGGTYPVYPCFRIIVIVIGVWDE